MLFVCFRNAFPIAKYELHYSDYSMQSKPFDNNNNQTLPQHSGWSREEERPHERFPFHSKVNGRTRWFVRVPPCVFCILPYVRRVCVCVCRAFYVAVAVAVVGVVWYADYCGARLCPSRFSPRNVVSHTIIARTHTKTDTQSRKSRTHECHQSVPYKTHTHTVYIIYIYIQLIYTVYVCVHVYGYIVERVFFQRQPNTTNQPSSAINTRNLFTLAHKREKYTVMLATSRQLIQPPETCINSPQNVNWIQNVCKHHLFSSSFCSDGMGAYICESVVALIRVDVCGDITHTRDPFR